MPFPDLTVITDPLHPVCRSVSWILDRRGERQLVVLDDLGDFDGYPRDIEYVILADLSEQGAVERALQHGDSVLVTCRGDIDRVVAVVSALRQARNRVLLIEDDDPDDVQFALAEFAVIGARLHEGDDLDRAAEALADLLTAAGGFYEYEIELGAPPELPSG